MPARTPAVPSPVATADASRAGTGDRFVRWPDVRARTGLSRTTIWRLERQGAFPARRQLSANTVAWLASEVDAWIASRASTRVEPVRDVLAQKG